MRLSFSSLLSRAICSLSRSSPPPSLFILGASKDLGSDFVGECGWIKAVGSKRKEDSNAWKAVGSKVSCLRIEYV